MKIVCKKCETELSPKQNGVAVIEMADFGPDKVWRSDVWNCRGCGAEVVAPFSSPISEHFYDDFDDVLEQAKKNPQGCLYDMEKPRGRAASEAWALGYLLAAWIRLKKKHDLKSFDDDAKNLFAALEAYEMIMRGASPFVVMSPPGDATVTEVPEEA